MSCNRIVLLFFTFSDILNFRCVYLLNVCFLVLYFRFWFVWIFVVASVLPYTLLFFIFLYHYFRRFINWSNSSRHSCWSRLFIFIHYGIAFFFIRPLDLVSCDSSIRLFWGIVNLCFYSLGIMELLKPFITTELLCLEFYA